jgi:hypothetical protein
LAHELAEVTFPFGRVVARFLTQKCVDMFISTGGWEKVGVLVMRL